MKYEDSLNHLRHYLIQIQDAEALERLVALEARWCALPEESALLDGAEPQYLLQELDKLTYRTAGTSFAKLCPDKAAENRYPRMRLSLTRLLQIVCVLLFLPGLGIAVASRNAQVSDLEKYDQIERETKAIDERIASDILGPFYLSFLKPCSPTTLDRLVETDIQVTLSGPDCIWNYIDPVSGFPIVKDQWAGEGIATREYYKDGLIIAKDVFDSNVKACFKSRSYFDDTGKMFGVNCFSEAGVALDPVFRDLRSPVPPPFYWFWLSYR